MDSLLTWFVVSLALVILVSVALYKVSVSRKPNVAYVAFFLLLLGMALLSSCLSALFTLVSFLI